MSSDFKLPSKDPLNIVFAGTPDFAAEILKSILAQGHHVSAVYCQPDRRVGRGKKLAFGPVKTLAVEKGITVEQPLRFNADIDDLRFTPIEKLASYKPDLMIVVAYGLLLPEDVLNTPKHGCVNIHASLLPRWRGAAPIQRAIEQGDLKTGITIMQMDKGLDTGNMLLKQSCEIKPSDTGSVLHDRLAELGCHSINEFLNSFSTTQTSESALAKNSSYSPGEVQDNQQATYAHKLTKAEAEIDWSEPAITIERKIRAFNSWPVCFTYVGKNRLRVWQASISPLEKVLEPGLTPAKFQPGIIISFDKHGIIVQCGDGQNLLLTQLQADGGRAMSVAELLNSKSQWFSEHSILGQVNQPSDSV